MTRKEIFEKFKDEHKINDEYLAVTVEELEKLAFDLGKPVWEADAFLLDMLDRGVAFYEDDDPND